MPRAYRQRAPPVRALTRWPETRAGAASLCRPGKQGGGPLPLPLPPGDWVVNRKCMKNNLKVRGIPVRVAWHEACTRVLRQPDHDESTMLDRLKTVFEPHERALRLRAYRSEVLAGNIANADTPNYKARDFDFQAAYRGALGQSDLPLTRTHAGHLGSSASAAAPSWLAYRHPVQPSIDGNTVELDAEVARYSENALRYQASLTFTSQRIRGLFSAIQGQ